MTINFFGGIQLTDIELTEKLKRTHILYKSIVSRYNVTASSEEAGFDVEGLANPLTFERWKPSSMPANVVIDANALVNVDCVGIASHTLYQNNCKVTIEGSITGTSWQILGSKIPSNSRSIMFVFQTVTYRYFRVSIAGYSAPSIGVIYIGKALVMPYSIYGGHTPITMGRKTSRITNKTEGGQYAGNTIVREGISGSFDFQHLSAAWYRENFDPFVLHARANPFFIAWRYGQYPTEVGYVWATDDITPENMGIRDLMSVSLKVDGYSDE